jgi:3-oxoacyl-[acyl-carrier protein] reductase
MDLRLAGRTALVTGASRGLGFAAATALAAEGTTVHIISRSKERIEDAASRIEAGGGGKVIPRAADLSDGSAIEKMLDAVGTVDILVSNTGGPPSGPLDSFDAGDWREQYSAIFESALNLSSALAVGMRRVGWGRIIYITSVSILSPILNLGFSNALRAGIAGLAKSQAIEWGREGLTVNCIAPGLFATDRLKQLYTPLAKQEGISLDEYILRKGSALPVGRIGEPEEIGSLIAYLASPRAGYINGTVLPIDGGKHL